MVKDESCVQIEVAASKSDLKISKQQVVGNVKLLDGKKTVLIPTPSPDPKGAYLISSSI